MIDLPKKLLYAIEAVVYIAYNASQGPISSKEVADRQNVPPRYLEQLLQKLVRANVLRGVRGPKGGYLLARERRRISVADICAVLEDGEDEVSVPTPLGHAVVMPLWQQARQAAIASLQSVTMADLCEQAQEKKIAKRAEERMDFVI